MCVCYSWPGLVEREGGSRGIILCVPSFPRLLTAQEDDGNDASDDSAAVSPVRESQPSEGGGEGEGTAPSSTSTVL